MFQTEYRVFFWLRQQHSNWLWCLLNMLADVHARVLQVLEVLLGLPNNIWQKKKSNVLVQYKKHGYKTADVSVIYTFCLLFIIMKPLLVGKCRGVYATDLRLPSHQHNPFWFLPHNKPLGFADYYKLLPHTHSSCPDSRLPVCRASFSTDPLQDWWGLFFVVGFFRRHRNRG